MEVWARLFLIVSGIALTVFLLFWAVMRILRPIDRAAKERNLPFRFSMGDFLCLFWVVQLPLAFVFQIEGQETEAFYWVMTVLVWAVAPIVWITCARALSKAGISRGMHRFIFLGIVVPTVYYGLFPFIWFTWVGVVAIGFRGVQQVLQYGPVILLWLFLMIGLFASGFYSPWMVRHAGTPAEPMDDDPF